MERNGHKNNPYIHEATQKNTQAAQTSPKNWENKPIEQENRKFNKDKTRKTAARRGGPTTGLSKLVALVRISPASYSVHVLV